MRTKECPKCGQDISDSYQSDDSDTGIVAGWYCEACDEGFTDEYADEGFDDDVHPSPAPFSQAGRCSKHPEAIPEMGYGLAGGGIGAYSYCPVCYTILNKTQDAP